MAAAQRSCSHPRSPLPLTAELNQWYGWPHAECRHERTRRAGFMKFKALVVLTLALVLVATVSTAGGTANTARSGPTDDSPRGASRDTPLLTEATRTLEEGMSRQVT